MEEGKGENIALAVTEDGQPGRFANPNLRHAIEEARVHATVGRGNKGVSCRSDHAARTLRKMHGQRFSCGKHDSLWLHAQAIEIAII